jgi:hypothetical protein
MEILRDSVQWRNFKVKTINLQVPQKTGNFLVSWVIISFYTRALLHAARLFHKKTTCLTTVSHFRLEDTIIFAFIYLLIWIDLHQIHFIEEKINLRMSYPHFAHSFLHHRFPNIITNKFPSRRVTRLIQLCLSCQNYRVLPITKVISF